VLANSDGQFSGLSFAAFTTSATDLNPLFSCTTIIQGARTIKATGTNRWLIVLDVLHEVGLREKVELAVSKSS